MKKRSFLPKICAFSFSMFSKALVFFLIVLMSNCSILAQVDDDWLVLDTRMECTITKAAQDITNDNQHHAYRYNEFDSEALAWEWYITDPATNDYEHWIKGAVFKDENLATEWWENKGLHHNYYDDSNENIQFWDVKQPLGDFHGENAVIKYRGFDEMGVEGTCWWKKDRFIFEVGNITKSTKDILITDNLISDLENIYSAANDCDLFKPIIELSEIQIDPFYDFDKPFYVCTSEPPMGFLKDNNGNYLTEFNDKIQISLLHEDLTIAQWEISTTYCNTSPSGASGVQCFPINFDTQIPPGSTFDNVKIHLQFQEVNEESKLFDIKQTYTCSFADYPESIDFEEEILLSFESMNLMDEDGDLPDIYIKEVFTGWESKTYFGSAQIKYLCPTEEELEGIDELWFVIHPCTYPYDYFFEDGITIPINKDVSPESAFEDIRVFGGPNDDYIAGMTAGEDPTELYLTGQFEGTSDMGNQILDSNGSKDAFVGKWNYVSDQFEWVMNIGSETGADIPVKVAFNPENEGLYTTFISEGDVVIGPNGEQLQCPPGGNIVQLKSNLNGEVIWGIHSGPVNRWAGTREAGHFHLAQDVVTDAAGNVFITGYFLGEIAFYNTDGEMGWSANAENDHLNLFLVKISNEGEILWGFHAAGNKNAQGTRLVADSEGNVYLSLYFDDSLFINGYSFDEGTGGALVKFDPDGRISWLMKISNLCIVQGMVLDQEEAYLYICGTAQRDCDFGGYVWTSDQWEYTRFFYGKISSDGVTQWIKHGETTADQPNHWPRQLAIDSEDNIYMTGHISDAVLSFSDIHLVPGNPDPDNKIIFVAAFNPDGEILWADMAADDTVGEEDYWGDYGHTIVIDGQDNAYLAGKFNNGAQFGESYLEGFGENDAFIARLNPGLITKNENLTKQNLQSATQLSQNFPNPAKTTTHIDFVLERSVRVLLEFFNPWGQCIQRIDLGHQNEGEHAVLIDVSGYVDGIYYYRLSTSKTKITKKMCVLR